MNLRKRNYNKELLDSDNIPLEDIKKNMRELGIINTWLGGHKITVAAAKKINANKKEITICEIGCGGGDNLAAIAKALSKDISLKFIGIDIKQECIDFAKQDPNNSYIVEWITSDYRNVSFTKKPDIIFSSLFCHHFTEDLLKEQLKWMKENSTIGFFINDLHRHPFAYYSIKWLTGLFSKSYLVKNDAPLSVLRGFKRRELEMFNVRCSILNAQLKWKWAFRWLLIAYNV